MDERKLVFTRLSGVNADIAGFLGRLMAEDDPGATVEYTVPLGRAAHLLGLRLQQTAVLLAKFSRFEDFGPEADVEIDAEADVEDESTTPYEEKLAGIDALRRNPYFPPELLEELFGDVGKDGILPGQVLHPSSGKRVDDQI